MASFTGGDVVIECLAREGIEKLFSVPGGQILTAYDAANAHNKVKLIVPRHEGAAGIMACGYAIGRGGPAAVMSTVGAGLIYAAGGVLMAWRERLPLLSISPQVQAWRMKPPQESLQACDQDEIMRPMTKFRAIIYHYDRIPQLIGRGLRTACAPEPGPVHLDIPVDVLFDYRKRDEGLMEKLFSPGIDRFSGSVPPDPEAVAKAAALIGKADRPLIFAGRGALRARAGAELGAFAEKARIPVVLSPAAFSALPTGSPALLGTTALFDGGSGLALLERTDLLVLVENDEHTARLAALLKQKKPGLKVMESAALAASVGSVVPVDAGLVGSPAAALSDLTAAARPGVDKGCLDSIREAASDLAAAFKKRLPSGPRLQGIMTTLELAGRAMKPEDHLIIEGELPAAAALAGFPHAGIHNVELLSDDYIPGAGYPLALGLKAAKPDSRVFLVTDAGLFKRHCRELQTASRYGLGVTSFLFQDREKKAAEEPDFAMMAKSLGVLSRSVIEPEEEITAEAVAEAGKNQAGMLFDATQ